MFQIISNSNISNILSLEIRNCLVYDDFQRTAKAHYFNVVNERLKIKDSVSNVVFIDEEPLKCGNNVIINCYYHIVYLLC